MFSLLKTMFIALTLVCASSFNLQSQAKSGRIGTVIIIQDRIGAQQVYSLDDCSRNPHKTLEILDQENRVLLSNHFSGEIVTVALVSIESGFKAVLSQGNCSQTITLQ